MSDVLSDALNIALLFGSVAVVWTILGGEFEFALFEDGSWFIRGCIWMQPCSGE